jgi:hypothetical protein
MPSFRPANNVRPAILSRIDSLAAVLENSRIWPFAIFLVLYLPLTILIASRKLIWDDEFFTVYLSRPASMADVLKGLATGADQHPPFFYFLTHQVMTVLGASHVTLRLVSLFGYGLFCICLFFLLRSRTSVLWATVGMFVPLISNPAYYYATEARGYALMLGFCALALLSWQQATALRKRLIWLCLLFVALALAVSSHYYAVLFLIPLGLGELVRTYSLKRFDLPIWVSFCGVAVSPIVFLSTIRQASKYSSHFWAVPYLSRVLDFYPIFIGNSSTILLLALVVFLVNYLWPTPYSDSGNHAVISGGTTSWEIVAWVGIAAIPLFAMVLAKLVTHAYIERYVIAALIGAVLIICTSGFHISCRSRVVPFLLVLICSFFFLLQGVLSLRSQSIALNTFLENLAALAPHTKQPLVISDITTFHRVSFYARRDFVQSFAYLSDPSSAIKFLGHDTIDRGLLDLRPWFPLNVVERAAYEKEHSQFLAYSFIGPWDWLTDDLAAPAYKTELLARKENRMLFDIQRVGPVSAIARRDDSQPLFKRISTTGPSLCEQWFQGDRLCVSIDRKLAELLTKTP